MAYITKEVVSSLNFQGGIRQSEQHQPKEQNISYLLPKGVCGSAINTFKVGNLQDELVARSY